MLAGTLTDFGIVLHTAPPGPWAGVHSTTEEDPPITDGPDPAPVVRRHMFISGYVQGVWFRHTCTEQAKVAGVAGWVGNCPDGRVEAVFDPASLLSRSVVASGAAP